MKTKADTQLNLLSGFAARLIEQSSTDDVLWLIIDQVVAALGFDDCVVYLLPSGQDALLQRAAYGDKQLPGRAIKDPIEIPLGRGIVGTAALLQKSLRISDAALDPRYILDDASRLSELSVPIIFEGRTLGVIDSEHQDANFFSEADETFLKTIANMTAARLAELIRREEVDQTDATLKAAIFQKQRDLKAQKAQGLDEVSVASRLSHDLKTPLNAIIGMTHILLEDTQDPTALEPLRIVQRAAEELNYTVDSLLAWLSPTDSPADKNALEIDILEFIESTSGQACARSEGEILITADELPRYLSVRAQGMQQVLLTLFIHALALSANRQIKLEVLLGELDQELGLIMILTNPHFLVSLSYQQQVFDPNFDTKLNLDDDRARRTHGLAAAKTLAERLGGKLELIAGIDQPACIQLVFPARLPAR